MEIPRWYRYGALSAVALLLLLGGLDALRTRPTPPDGTDARETPKPKARRPAPSLASGLETWTENLPRLPQAPLPSAPSGSQGPRLPSSLPFREFSSDKAQPYLDVTNDTYESLYMYMNGPCLKQPSILPGHTVRITLEPGEYYVMVWGETLPRRVGEGVFRRYKRYEVTWVVARVPAGTESAPLHLGD